MRQKVKMKTRRKEEVKVRKEGKRGGRESRRRENISKVERVSRQCFKKIIGTCNMF